MLYKGEDSHLKSVRNPRRARGHTLRTTDRKIVQLHGW